MDNQSILLTLKEREAELKKMVDQLKNAENELSGTQKAIMALEEINDPQKKAVKKIASNGTITATYNPTLTWKEKIKTALINLQKGSATEVVTFIQQNETIDNDKAYRIVTSVLHNLYKNKEIKARKNGRKKIYWL